VGRSIELDDAPQRPSASGADASDGGTCRHEGVATIRGIVDAAGGAYAA